VALSRRFLVSTAALSALAVDSASSQPRQWPNRPIRIIIPYAPGGPVEIPGRFIAEHLTQRLGQPVIIETRPGAGGALGTKQVIAAQDDHTFLMITGAVAIQPAVQPDIGYDPLTDLLPVSLVSESSMCFAVRPNAPFQDLQGLVAAAKANPGKITYGTSGNGTTTHMAPALFGIRAGISWQHVPYRGAGQLISGFLAGDVDVMSADLAASSPIHYRGRARYWHYDLVWHLRCAQYARSQYCEVCERNYATPFRLSPWAEDGGVWRYAIAEWPAGIGRSSAP